MNRIIQNGVRPTVPTVELDAGDTDVDDGWQIEQDQEGQGSNQAGLGERQEIEIVTESCLGNYQSKCDDDDIGNRFLNLKLYLIIPFRRWTETLVVMFK